MEMFSGLLDLMQGRQAAAVPAPTDDFWFTPMATPNMSGVAVTPDIALKSSALYAVLKVLSETVASMPMEIHKNLADGGRELATNHPLYELLAFQPNHYQTATEFWEMQMFHAAGRGTAYAEIIPGPRGSVDQLLPLHPARVQTLWLEDDTLAYDVHDPRTGRKRRLLQDEVFRIPGLASNGVTGMPAIELAAEDIGLGMSADAYAARVFSNKLNIGGFLVHPGKLSPEGQKNLIKSLMERFTGSGNAHRPMVLQEGMKFEKASMDASQAQLLEARKWQTILIAQRFRVPLHMLAIDDQTNRSTVEQQAQDFTRYTLRPWVRKIEQAIRRDLITAKTTYAAKFNMNALLRGDIKTRGEYYAKALGSGGHRPWMSVNEIRALENQNPVPGGDVMEPPVNMQNQIAPPEPEPEEEEEKEARLPAPPVRIEDNSLRARAVRMVNKEIVAIRRAKMRFAGDDAALGSYVESFYGGHVSSVMTTLEVPKEVAKAYCDHVLKEVRNQNYSAYEEMFNNWDRTRVDEIVNSIGDK